MPVSIEETSAWLRRRDDERRQRASARAQALRTRLPEAKQLLVEKYGARRVVLFGSLARNELTERSDLDLAVEGLQSAGYFTALADLMGLFDAPVDLFEFETAPAGVRARIAFEGIEL